MSEAAGPNDGRSGQRGEPGERGRPLGTAIRVFAVQAGALLLLWLLQSAYHR